MNLGFHLVVFSAYCRKLKTLQLSNTTPFVHCICAESTFAKREIHGAVFFSALERPEGVAAQDFVAMEEFQQRINAVSLEKVKFYYRRLR